MKLVELQRPRPREAFEGPQTFYFGRYIKRSTEDHQRAPVSSHAVFEPLSVVALKLVNDFLLNVNVGKMINLEKLLWGSNLFEGISSIVYHYSRDPISVLRDNELFGSFLYDTELKSTEKRDRAWYISTTRSTHSSYLEGDYIVQVIFELDGNKISNSHAGIPFNHQLRKGDKLELEDRVLLQEPSLKNLNKYLRRIIVGIQVDNFKAEKRSNQIKTILACIEYGKKYGVEIAFVERGKKYTSTKGKEIDISDLLDEESGQNISQKNKGFFEKWYKGSFNAHVLHFLHFGWMEEKALDSLFVSVDDLKSFPLYFHVEQGTSKILANEIILFFQKKLRRKILLDEVNSILRKIRITKDIIKDEQPKWDELELKLSKDLQEKIRKTRES